MQLLVFTIDSNRFAIGAADVSEIVRAVALTALPGAPAVISGIIDVRGTVVPVFDLRKRFGFSERGVIPSDQFILVRTLRRVVALHVDTTLELIDIDESAIADLSRALPPTQFVEGVAPLADGMALIHNVERFLSSAESSALDSELTALESA